ncbi:MAG: hypothetical protein NVSMB57_01250 [Actinomycetota bacterium]
MNILEIVPGGGQERAACKGADPELFFGQTDREAAQAKALCARCAVSRPCLDFALASRERVGIWGGLTESERRRRADRTAVPADTGSPAA